MPRCVKCNEVFPPSFMFDVDDDAQECVFCKLGKKTLTLQESGTERKITKQECINKYKEKLNELASKKDIARHLVGKNQKE